MTLPNQNSRLDCGLNKSLPGLFWTCLTREAGQDHLSCLEVFRTGFGSLRPLPKQYLGRFSSIIQGVLNPAVFSSANRYRRFPSTECHSAPQLAAGR